MTRLKETISISGSKGEMTICKSAKENLHVAINT